MIEEKTKKENLMAWLAHLVDPNVIDLLDTPRCSYEFHDEDWWETLSEDEKNNIHFVVFQLYFGMAQQTLNN